MLELFFSAVTNSFVIYYVNRFFWADVHIGSESGAFDYILGRIGKFYESVDPRFADEGYREKVAALMQRRDELNLGSREDGENAGSKEEQALELEHSFRDIGYQPMPAIRLQCIPKAVEKTLEDWLPHWVVLNPRSFVQVGRERSEEDQENNRTKAKA